MRTFTDEVLRQIKVISERQQKHGKPDFDNPTPAVYMCALLLCEISDTLDKINIKLSTP